MLDGVHPAKYLSTSSQFILLDATSTRDGILLTTWCPPPQPNLPANSRPVCYAQETDFALGLVDSARKAQKTQLVFRHPPTQTVTDTASRCSIAELHIRAAADCLGAQRGCSRGHGRSVCSTAAEGPDQTAAVSGVPSQQPLNSPAVPHLGKALGNPVTLFIQPLRSFSLRSQAEDDKSRWRHHQL